MENNSFIDDILDDNSLFYYFIFCLFIGLTLYQLLTPIPVALIILKPTINDLFNGFFSSKDYEAVYKQYWNILSFIWIVFFIAVYKLFEMKKRRRAYVTEAR